MTHPYIHLLIIDPQVDFVDPQGALYVTGAERDAERLSTLIEKTSPRLREVTLSLDSHHRLDISHPLWFRDEGGHHPAPFTQITASALESGMWTCAEHAYERTLAYLYALERRQRYPHVIWPEHCLIGSRGHSVYPMVYEAVQTWASQPRLLNFIRKGENPWTEHFSAIEAEVPIEDDPHTQKNFDLISNLKEADQVWVAGWARSHCVGNTVRDLIRYGGDELAQKLVLVSDTMSDVSGFEGAGETFSSEVIARGVRAMDTAHLIAMS